MLECDRLECDTPVQRLICRTPSLHGCRLEACERDHDVERADVAVLEDDGQLQRRQRVGLDAQVVEPQVARREASEVDRVGVEVLDEALKLLADQVRNDLLEHGCGRVSARRLAQPNERQLAVLSRHLPSRTQASRGRTQASLQVRMLYVGTGHAAH